MNKPKVLVLSGYW